MQCVLKQLEKQKGIDEWLIAELNSGSHSFEQPLVVLDPYGDSPLTAVVVFETGSPSTVAISIQASDLGCGVDFAFDGYAVRHLIPVYGLYPDTNNEVTISAADAQGRTRTNVLRVRTPALPSDLGRVNVDVVTEQTGDCQPGFTFVYKNRPKFAFDAAGKIRWFLDLPTNMATLYDFRGHIVVTSGIYLGTSLLYEIDLLGRIYAIGETPYGAHHAIEEVGSGQLLVTGSGRGRTIKDLLYEFSLDTGKIGNVLDFNTILDPSRVTRNSSRRDWLHLNAVVWSGDDSSILVSARNQSVIAKLSYPEGKILWILGDHENWLPEYVKYLLTPAGEHFVWQHSQHSPIIVSERERNPGIVDLMVFDNHSFLESRWSEGSSKERYSRLVEYRIDERRKTVEQVWEFGSENGVDLFTHHCGSVTQMANGNILSYFNLCVGHRWDHSRIIELQRQTGRVVFDAIIYDRTHRPLGDYRCARRALYSSSDNDLCHLRPVRDNVSDRLRTNVGQHTRRG